MRISIHSESFFWIPVWITSPIHSAPFKKKGNFYPPLLLFLSLSLCEESTQETMSRGDFVDKSHLIYNHSSWEFFLLHFFVWWWMAEILPPFITLVSVSICTTISHNSCDYFDPTEPMFWYICLVSSADGSLGKSFSFLLAEVGCTGGSAAFVLADSDLLAVSMVAV